MEGSEGINNLFIRQGELESNRAVALSSIREAELELKVGFIIIILFFFCINSYFLKPENYWGLPLFEQYVQKKNKTSKKRGDEEGKRRGEESRRRF